MSLRHYLAAHPGVFMGGGGMFGEPNFFIAEDNWPRGRGWYESLFDGAGRAAAVGECSPCYTWAHVYGGVPGRMARHSAGTPGLRGTRPHRPPAVDVHASSVSRPGAAPRGGGLVRRPLFGGSGYDFQLAATLDHFDRGRGLVVASEVLRDRPREALSAGFDHLGSTRPRRTPASSIEITARLTSPSRASTISGGYPTPGQAPSAMATRPAQRAGPVPDHPASAPRRLRDPIRTPRPTRRAPWPRPAPLRASPRLPGARSLEMVNSSSHLTPAGVLTMGQRADRVDKSHCQAERPRSPLNKG